MLFANLCVFYRFSGDYQDSLTFNHLENLFIRCTRVPEMSLKNNYERLIMKLIFMIIRVVLSCMICSVLSPWGTLRSMRKPEGATARTDGVPVVVRSASKRVLAPGKRISAHDQALIESKHVERCKESDCAVGEWVIVVRSDRSIYGRVTVGDAGKKFIEIAPGGSRPFAACTVYKLVPQSEDPKKKAGDQKKAEASKSKRKAPEVARTSIDLTGEPIDLTGEDRDGAAIARPSKASRVKRSRPENLRQELPGDRDGESKEEKKEVKRAGVAIDAGARATGLTFSLESVVNQCLGRPEYVVGSRTMFDYHKPIFSLDDVTTQLAAFFKRTEQEGLFDKSNWYNPGQIADSTILKDPTQTLPNLYTNTFIQRCDLDLRTESSTVISVGDIHGSVHALARLFLAWKHLGYIDNNFKIIHSNIKFVFTGDVPDRGRNGAEAFMMLLRFKLANWPDVFILRGNHETSEASDKYGFSAELTFKYGGAGELLTNSFYTLYELLPLGLFMSSGTDSAGKTVYRFFAHGGPSVLHDPRPFLNSRAQYDFLGDTDEKYIEILIEHTIIANDSDTVIRSACTDSRGAHRHPADTINWTDIVQEHEFKSACCVFNDKRMCGHRFDVAGLRRYWSFLSRNEFGIRFCGLVRGHDDKDRVCKLLFHDSRDVVEAREAGLEGLPHTSTGQQDWKDVVAPAELAKAPTHGVPLEGRHAPVYTMTTATEGQSVPHEGFIRIIVTPQYADGRFFVYERDPLRDIKAYGDLDAAIRDSVRNVGFAPLAHTARPIRHSSEHATTATARGSAGFDLLVHAASLENNSSESTSVSTSVAREAGGTVARSTKYIVGAPTKNPGAAYACKHEKDRFKVGDWVIVKRSSVTVPYTYGQVAHSTSGRGLSIEVDAGTRPWDSYTEIYRIPIEEPAG